MVFNLNYVTLAYQAIFIFKALGSTEAYTHAFPTKTNLTRSFVLGDWGGLPDFPYRTHIETAVASQLGQFASKTNIDSVFALGDNFYYDGVKDVHDPRFNSTFEDVFKAASLTSIPWYVIAGNHDWNGNVSAQIAYTKVSKRWYFPHYYYAVYLGGDPQQRQSAAAGSLVHVVMIDTVMLCGNTDDFNNHHRDTNASARHNDTFTSVLPNKKQSEQQWQWIEKQLAQSQSPYLLVAGHYPVWSVGEHGPTKCLVDRLRPMLYKYRVSAYLCGHDHSLQHLSVTESSAGAGAAAGGNWTVEFLLTGAANFMDASALHNNSVPQGALQFHWADYMSIGGFGYMEASAQALTFSFMESKGRVLHQVTIHPSRPT